MRHVGVHSGITRLIVAVIAAVLGSFPLSAQISVSDTVRLQLRYSGPVLVMVAPPDVRGVVIRRDSAVIVLQQFGDGGNVEVFLSDIATAEVLRGTRRRGWGAVRQAAFIGAGVGAVAGGMASGDDGSNNKGEFHLDPGFAAIGGALLGSVGGVVVGGVLGLITRTDNWVPAELGGLALHAELVPRGAGIILALRWER